MNLINTLKALLQVTPKSDIRYYLNGIQVIRNGNEVVFNSTDGLMLLQVKTTDLEYLDIQDGVQFIICRKSLDVMIKSFTKNNTPVLRCDDDFKVTLGDLPLVTIDGRYPDAQRVIRESSERCDVIGVNYTLLAKLSKACATVTNTNFTCGKLKVRGATDSILFENSYDDYSFIALLMPARI